MHPSCLEPRTPSPGRERLASIPGGKLDVALRIYHKELLAIVEGQSNLKLASNVDDRPKPFSHFVRWARRWLQLQANRQETRPDVDTAS